MAYGTLESPHGLYGLAGELFVAAANFREDGSVVHGAALDAALLAYADMLAAIATARARARMPIVLRNPADYAADYRALRDSMDVSDAMRAMMDETYGYHAKESAE